MKLSDVLTVKKDYSGKRPKCKDCVLRHRPFVPSYIAGSEVVVVGEAPGYTEVEKKTPFVGESGQLLRQVLTEVGFDIDKISFLNAVKCHPLNNETPDANTRDLCAGQFLKFELSDLKPKLVILAGATALNVFFPDDKITEKRGNLLTKDGVTFLPVFHPAYCLRNATAVPALRKDLKRAEMFLRGEYDTDYDYNLANSIEDLQQIRSVLLKQDILSLDIETNKNLDPFHPEAKIWTIAFGYAEKKAYCIPLDHPEITNLPFKEKCWEVVREICASDIKKVLHNGSFDIKWLIKFGCPVKNFYADTMVMVFLVDENRYSYKLKELASEYLDGCRYQFNSDLKALAIYNAEDADNTLRLYYKIIPQLSIRPKLLALFNKVVMPMCGVIADMELNGIMIDMDYVRKLSPTLRRKVNEIKEQIIREFPDAKGVDLASPKQLADLMFRKLGYSAVKETRTGQDSVDSEVLEKLAEEGKKFPMYLLKVRKYEKLLSTYVDKLPTMISADGRLRGSFHIIGTKSGRLSCVAPWTPVVTFNGLKEIKDVCIGDYVWTHRGRWRRVVATQIKGIEPMFDVYLSNGRILTCTGQHRVLLSNGVWVSIQEVMGDEYLQEMVCRELGEGGEAVQVRGLSNHRGIEPRVQYTVAKHLSYCQDAYTQRGVSGIETDKILLFQDAGKGQPVCSITKINPTRSYQVYDITVEEDHSYLACGIFSHNSSEPNLQNIPRDKEIKKMFRAQSGYVLINVDASQAELRVGASIALEKNMINAYNNNIDIHKLTASKILNKSIDEVDKDERQKAKGCIDGEAYLMSSRGVIKLKDVRVGDLVFTGRGYKRVLAKKKTGYRYCCHLANHLGYDIFATSDHRFLTNRGWLTAETTKGNIGFYKSVVYPAWNIVERCVVFPKYPFIKRTCADDNFPLPKVCDKDLALFMGFFVAEGYLTKKKMSFVMCNRFRELERVGRRLFKRYWQVRRVGKYRKMNIYSTKFIQWCHSIGLIGPAEDKHIPDCILQSPAEVQGAFIRGLWLGDGSIMVGGKSWVARGKIRDIKLSSKSKRLIQQVQMLLLQNGILCSCSVYNHKKFGDFYTVKIVYEFREKFLQFTKLSNVLHSHRWGERKLYFDCVEGAYLIPFSKTVCSKRKYDVYDLEVEDDHRFSANGFIVHNCNFGFLYGQSAEGFQHYAGGTYGLKLSMKECEQFRARFFEAYPGLLTWYERTKRLLRQFGYIEYPTGRLCRFPEVKGKAEIPGAIFRKAVNYPVQGCLSGETLICVKDKGVVSLASVVGKTISLWDGSRFVNGTVVSSGKKRKVVVDFYSGLQIICSPNHKFLTVNSKGSEIWKTPQEFTKSLTNKTYVKVSSAIDNFGYRMSFPLQKATAQQKKAERLFNHKNLNPIIKDCLAVEKVTFLSDEIEMYDVVNTDSGRFMANGVIVHNSSSDIMLYSMARLKKFIDRSKFPARMLLTVHDSILLEVEMGKEQDIIQEIKDIAGLNVPKQFPFLKVPWVFDFSVGENWGEMHEVKDGRQY